jgi:hypothetical protein
MAVEHKWIFKPGFCVGPFRFGISRDAIRFEYDLYSEGDVNYAIKRIRGEPDHPDCFSEGEGETFGVNGFNDVSFGFDENDLLETIYDGESFVFLGDEIIGLPEKYLCVFFGKEEDLMCFKDSNASLYTFHGDIIVSVISGYVNRVTVSSYSVPYPKAKTRKPAKYDKSSS